MKMIIKLITILFLILSIFSCEKEFIPDIENPNSKIVINSLVNNSEEMNVTVTKNFSITGASVVEDWKDAQVSIFENNVFIENLNYYKGQEDIVGAFKTSFIPELETDYRIEVNQEGVGIASAKTQIPEGIDISNASVKHVGDNSYQFNFILSDPAEVNYYFLKMYFLGYKLDSVSQEKIYVEEHRIEIPTASIPEGTQYIDNGFIFKDDTFKGNDIVFTGIAKSGRTITPFDEPEEDILTDSTIFFIRLETLSEDAFKFYSSHSIALGTEIDIFSEATSIYGNVENGLGIFAGIYVSEVAVEVE